MTFRLVDAARKAPPPHVVSGDRVTWEDLAGSYVGRIELVERGRARIRVFAHNGRTTNSIMSSWIPVEWLRII